MHNQHAGLSETLAAQRIAERHEQAAQAPGPTHILGPEYQDDPPEGPSVSEFDEQFLHRHAMAWSADRRPD
jgi:hypothetical protein